MKLPMIALSVKLPLTLMIVAGTVLTPACPPTGPGSCMMDGQLVVCPPMPKPPHPGR